MLVYGLQRRLARPAGWPQLASGHRVHSCAGDLGSSRVTPHHARERVTESDAIRRMLCPSLQNRSARSPTAAPADCRGGGLHFGGIWTVLIVMQVAVMAIVPTPVIAIYGDTVKGARAANAGLVPEQYLALTIAMDREKVFGAAGATFTGRFAAATQELERRLEAKPGVTGVTVASVLPLMNHPWRTIEIDEASAARGERNSSRHY